MGVSGFFIKNGARPRVTMLDGVHRKTFGTTRNMMLCEISLEEGTTVPPHRHDNEQIGYVVAGRIRMTIDGVTEVLSAGDNYAVEAGVEHSAEAVTDTVVVDVFHPEREDYR